MYHTILTLRKQGKSLRAIARDLSLSTTTVCKYLKMSEQDAEIHSCRRAGKSEFTIAEDYIRNRLSLKPRLRCSRLYEEVLQHYPQISSKQRAFRTYVGIIRDTIPKQVQRYFAVIETDPGKQIQVDIGEMKVDGVNGRCFKVFFTSFVLSCSRQMFVHWQLNHYRTADFLEAHRQAFRFFEGVPEECVYDQTKLVVIQEKYREVILNETFHQFALKVGYHPHVCEGYDPQSKGKVERVIQEVKEGFLYGRVFSNLQDVQAQGYQWLAKFNNRIHATTGLVPAEAWKTEKCLLKTIPAMLVQPVVRKADKTGLISYSGNKYSVPQVYQDRAVVVLEEEGNLLVLDPVSSALVATHAIPAKKGCLIKSYNHYRDYKTEYQTLLALTTDMMRVYPNGESVVKRLVQDNPRIARDQMRALKKLFNNYDESVWLTAMPLIDQQPSLRATLIETILYSTERSLKLSKLGTISTDQPILGSVIQRSLTDYLRATHHAGSN